MPLIRIIDDVASFRAPEAWGAREVAEIDGVSVRLHWTDKPYRWHVNDGTEVFVVLGGEVAMRYRQDGEERSVRLRPSDIFVAGEGEAHVAHPLGEARILVIERKGSD